MEDLPNSNLQLVLGVKEGGNFDRILKPTIIIATLNGHCRESKEIQSDCNPQYATDLTWDTDKNSLRKMRCNQTPVKIECYAVNDNGSREKVGYTLVSVRAAQIVPQDKESSIRTTWHDILGIRNDFSSCRPKLLLYLIIKERKEIKPDRNSISTSVDSYQVRDSNANDMPVWLEEEHLIQLGPPDTCKDIFLFSIVARAANNLVDSVSDYEMNRSCRISIIYHVFDSFFSLRPFESRLASTLLINEKIVVRMRSSFCALLNYLKSKSHFLIKMKVDGTFVGQSEINLESLVETNYIQSINKKTYGSASTKDYFCELRNTDSKRIEEGQKRGDVVTKAAGLEVHIRLQHVGTSNAMIENGQRVTYEPQPSVGFQRKPNHLDEKVNLTSVPYFCRNPDPSIYKEHHQIFNQKLTSSGENLEYPFINSPVHGMCNYPQNNPSKSFRTRTYRSYCLSVHLKAIKFFDPDPDLQKIEFRFYQPEGEIINKVCVNISVGAGQMVSLEDVNCKLYFITTTQEFEGFLETFCPRINVCNASSSVRKCLAQVNFDIRKFLLSKKNLLEYEAPMTSCRDKEKLGIISTSITLRECVATAHKNELNGYENPLKKVDDLDVWKKKQKESFLKEFCPVFREIFIEFGGLNLFYRKDSRVSTVPINPLDSKNVCETRSMIAFRTDISDSIELQIPRPEL
ncbi:hypothetical protein QAD02_021950 [Eretmocerus hayati]|uniref:Uncharacterized protein n=1 Tax=Eretmocerus hayati TaxID=131215 RepID=A0ACC2PTP3_9HYME|nr:hypothetical protein QAD02_021950 [Eretmocerus hayati]